MLNKRARAILYALISEFMETGEPVGSRTLSKKPGLDLSAATIRNVLADLEDAGFLVQPHTSAGRVPTLPAFRLFIDGLMRLKALSTDQAARLAEWADGSRSQSDLLRDAGHLLSELTDSAAIIVRYGLEERRLRALRFLVLGPDQLLAVLVLNDDTVKNTFLSLERPIVSEELERLHNLLAETVEGRTLKELRDYFAAARDKQQDELRSLQGLGAALVDSTILAQDDAPQLVVEGQNRLIGRREFASSEKLRSVLRAVEDQDLLVAFIDKIVDEGRVSVVFAEETESGDAALPLSVVGASYKDGAGKRGGTLGVLGPIRMDYPGVIPLVGAAAEAVSAAMAKHSGEGNDGSSRDPSGRDDDG